MGGNGSKNRFFNCGRVFKHSLIQTLIFGGWSYQNARFQAPREASNATFVLKMKPLGKFKIAILLSWLDSLIEVTGARGAIVREGRTRGNVVRFCK